MRSRSPSAKVRLASVFGVVLASASLEGCFFPPCDPSVTPVRSIVPLTKKPADDKETKLACAQYCGVTDSHCKLIDTENGSPALACESELRHECGGAARKPRGYTPRRLRRATTREARLLALRADLEAASVVAFEDLAVELERFGAPKELASRARRAAADEAHHAEAMGDLAKRAGAPPFRARRARKPSVARKSLLSWALSNAREGCVFETMAALEALRESRTATDSRVRHTMTRIAREELRHAELSRDIDSWVRTKLSPRGVAALDRAHARAWNDLAKTPLDPAIPSLGVASGLERRELARVLSRALSV